MHLTFENDRHKTFLNHSPKELLQRFEHDCILKENWRTIGRMRNRILEIVVFLMDYMGDERERQSEADDVSAALRNLGYSDQEISSAYTWFLEQFKGTPEQFFSKFPKNHSSQRMLTDTERMYITSDAQGLLIKLLDSTIISDEQMEAILERAIFFATEPITLEQIKIIASAVVFNETDELEDSTLLRPMDDRSYLVN